MATFSFVSVLMAELLDRKRHDEKRGEMRPAAHSVHAPHDAIRSLTDGLDETVLWINVESRPAHHKRLEARCCVRHAGPQKQHSCAKATALQQQPMRALPARSSQPVRKGTQQLTDGALKAK